MIRITCPCCRAANSEPMNCRRCKADLSLLWELEDQRQRLLERLGGLVEAGEWQTALAVAKRAHQLRPDTDTLRALAGMQLLNRQFEEAWQSRRLLDSTDRSAHPASHTQGA